MSWSNAYDEAAFSAARVGKFENGGGGNSSLMTNGGADPPPQLLKLEASRSGYLKREKHSCVFSGLPVRSSYTSKSSGAKSACLVKVDSTGAQGKREEL